MMPLKPQTEGPPTGSRSPPSAAAVNSYRILVNNFKSEILAALDGPLTSIQNTIREIIHEFEQSEMSIFGGVR